MEIALAVLALVVGLPVLGVLGLYGIVYSSTFRSSTEEKAREAALLKSMEGETPGDVSGTVKTLEGLQGPKSKGSMTRTVGGFAGFGIGCFASVMYVDSHPGAFWTPAIMLAVLAGAGFAAVSTSQERKAAEKRRNNPWGR